MLRIFVVHPVKHQRALEHSLITQGHIRVLIGDFQQSLANGTTLGFAQLREFLDDFRRAHGEILVQVGRFVRGHHPANFNTARVSSLVIPYSR